MATAVYRSTSRQDCGLAIKMDKTFFMDGFFPAGNHALATMPFTTKDKGSSQPFEIHFREIERVAHDYKGRTRNATKFEVLQLQVLPLSVANATQTILPAEKTLRRRCSREREWQTRARLPRRGTQQEMTPSLAAVKIACKKPSRPTARVVRKNK